MAAGNDRCDRCGTEAVLTLGTTPLCWSCAEEIREPIRDKHLIDEGPIGRGIRSGPWRNDWGQGWAPLSCPVCAATWVGSVGEPCGYCIRTRELLIDAHRTVLLRPDPEMVTTPEKCAAWARRLRWAVAAEILTEHEALAALAREEARRAA